MKYILILLLLPGAGWAQTLRADSILHVTLSYGSKPDSIYYDTVRVVVHAFFYSTDSESGTCRVIFTTAQRKNTVIFPGRKLDGGYTWWEEQKRTERTITNVLDMPAGWEIWETREMNWKRKADNP